MPSTGKKSLLVVVRRSPYGSSLARTSLEVALSSVTFDQEISVLFMGDGVLHLVDNQNSRTIGVRNVEKLIASFPLYELNQLFADDTALVRYGLCKRTLPQDLRRLNEDAMHDLMSKHDHILGF